MLRIALGQMEIIPGRPDLNAKTMLGMIEEARLQAQIIIFPALCLSGSLIGDNWQQQSFIRDCQEYGRQIIQASGDIGVIFGNAAAPEGARLCDAVYLAYQGALLKPNNSPYPFWLRQLDNSRHFTGLLQLAAEVGQTPENLQTAMILQLDKETVSLGYLTGYGRWPSPSVSPGGGTGFIATPSAQLLVHLASTPFASGRGQEIDKTLSAEAAKRGLPLIYINNTGIQNKGKTVYIYDGSSTVYNGRGEIALRGPSFASGITYLKTGLSAGQLPEAVKPETAIKDIYRALFYGIKKFLCQTGIERVVIGASGGIDSAVNAALFNKVLGPEQLLLVNMPSRYNSRTTRDLAAELAENLGCRYTVVSIQESVDYTIRQIEEGKIFFPGQPRSGSLTVSSSAAENIQARDRSARILAALAAVFNGGFTCNANKSETTIGYSTLYGDLAGFLAPLADLWKHQVYQLADYLNQHVYQREVVPHKSIEIKPSAELSPAQAVEEGKGDPLHYPYHDYLFRAFMENPFRATPEDILEWYLSGLLEEKIGCAPGLVKELFPETKTFIADLERWWKLYAGLATAKRIQGPPILSVSRRAFGADLREAQNSPYFTKRYLEMKEKLV